MGKRKIWKTMVNIGGFCALLRVRQSGNKAKRRDNSHHSVTNAGEFTCCPTKATERLHQQICQLGTPTDIYQQVCHNYSGVITIVTRIFRSNPDDPKRKTEESTPLDFSDGRARNERIRFPIANIAHDAGRFSAILMV